MSIRDSIGAAVESVGTFAGKLLSLQGSAQQPVSTVYQPSPATSNTGIPPNVGIIPSGGEHSNGRDTSGPPPSVKQVSPTGDPPTTVYIDKLVQPNCMNVCWQPTYHFRLFVSSDGDIIKNAGNPTKYTDLTKKINGATIPKVVLAESGVTGYNIKEVEIDTVIAQNDLTLAQSGTSFRMTITEPLGVSFLDALFGACTLVGTEDYTKGTFYLELTFLGYDDTGNPLNPAANFKNGGDWIWGLVLVNIETKVDENGGSYQLNFVVTDVAPIILENKVLSSSVSPKSFTIEGDTVGKMLDDYATKLNAAWVSEYQVEAKQGSSPPLYKFAFNADSPIQFGQGKGQKPAQFNLIPRDPDKNPQNHLSMDSTTKLPSMTVPAGTPINEVVTSIIKSSDDAKLLILDQKVTNTVDLSPTQVNDHGFRETVLFSIETDVQTSEKTDKVTGNYYKLVTIHIKPFYTQSPILSRPQVDNATNPDDPQSASVQRKMVESYAKNGFINKRYDYIFTGLNTEVIDFKIDFNLAWQAQLAAHAGERMSFQNVRTNAKLNPQNLSKSAQGDPVPDNTMIVQNFISLANASFGTGATSPAPVPLRQASQADQFGLFSSMLAESPSTTKSAPPNAVQQAMAAISQPSRPGPTPTNAIKAANPQLQNGTVYIEDLLTSLNQGRGPTLPISFCHVYLDAQANSGIGPISNNDRGKSTIGSSYLQANGRLVSTGAFQTAELTIRGDPFWLGQTNLERQIALRNGVSYTVPQATGSGTPPISPPDWVSGNQVIFLRLVYPLQISDDSTPILSDSAVFNGFYEVTNVKHSFSDGSFKQTLKAVRLPLIDPKIVFGTTPPNGKPAS